MTTSPSGTGTGVPSFDLRPQNRRSAVAAVNALSPVPTYIGLAVTVIGFVLVAVTWIQVAKQVNVAVQLPYFASGGFGGLGLIMVGLTTVSVAAKRRDSLLRAAQMELLATALYELRVGLSQDR